MALSRGTGLNGRDPLGRHREGLAAAPQRQVAPDEGSFRIQDQQRCGNADRSQAMSIVLDKKEQC